MFRESGQFESGQRVERELLGGAVVGRSQDGPDYLVYREAFKDARGRQPGDPTDPKADFAYEVLIRIEEILSLEGRVRYYTAVGTILDRKHGVDAWFEIDGGRMATIDLTTGRSKGKETTDIDFPVPGDGLDRTVNEQEFLGHAEALAERVVDILSAQERLVRAS